MTAEHQDPTRRLGGLAAWLGLNKTAELILNHLPREPLPAPEVEWQGDPPLIAIMKSLNRAPHNPSLIALLFDLAYVDACPATVSVISEQLIRDSIWPGEHDPGLRADLVQLAGYSRMLFGGEPTDDAPDLQFRKNAVALNRLYFAESGFGYADAGGPLERLRMAKQIATDMLDSGTSAVGRESLAGSLSDAARQLPDWEAMVYQSLSGVSGSPFSPPKSVVEQALLLANWAVLAGLPGLAFTVSYALWPFSKNPELAWFLVDIALEQMGVEVARGLLDEFPEPSGDPAARDNYICAHARVALEEGNLDLARSVLEPVTALAPKARASRFPRSSVMVVELAMRNGEALTAELREMALHGLMTDQAWPVANRLAITMSLAVNLSQGITENAFALLFQRAEQMPAEVSLWRAAWHTVSRYPVGFEPFMDGLQEQILKAPFVRGYWELLAGICGFADLTRAIEQDLALRDRNPAAARTRSKSLLARAVDKSPLRNLEPIVGPGSPALSLPALPESVAHWMRSTDLNPPDASPIFMAMQLAPASDALVGRLWKMGLFSAFPVVGALVALDLTESRDWSEEQSAWFGGQASIGDSLFHSDLSVVDAFSAAVGDDVPGNTAWAGLLQAKKSWLQSADNEQAGLLLRAVHRTGDPEGAVMLARAGKLTPPFVPILSFVYNLRVSGFLRASAVIGERLQQATGGRNITYFAVDALLELGLVDRAVALLERCGLTLDQQSAEQDLQLAALARVALATSGPERALDLLGSLDSLLRAGDLKPLGERYPNSSLVLAAARMDRDGVADTALLELVKACLPAVPQLPFGRAVVSQALYLYGLTIDENGALAGVQQALCDMPGEFGLFRRLWPQVKRGPLAQRLIALLENHLSRFWYLRRGWFELERIWNDLA